jgi:Flp pilus assembly protein TadG
LSVVLANSSAQSFRANNAGAVAVTVALFAVALTLAAGIAIDMGRVYFARATAQESVDQAVIAAAAVAYSEAGSLSPNEAKMKEVVKAYLASNSGVSSDLVGLAEPSVSYQTEPEDMVTVSVAGRIETTFLRIANIDEVNFTVSSTAKRPETDMASLDLETRDGPLELALVVDQSLPMAGNFGGTPKFEALRGAVTGLAERVMADSEAKVGVVPFGTWLSVERGHWREPWLNFSNLSVSESGSCEESGGAGCEPGVSESSFNGCFMTRPSLPDTIARPTDPAYPAKPGSCSQIPILDLTGAADSGGTGLDMIRGRIAQLVPADDDDTGGTYMPGGLEFGWHMLAAGQPLDRATTADQARRLGVRKNLVLVSGGENNVFPAPDGRWRSYLPGAAASQSDDPAEDSDLSTENLCSRIKDAGITIHVVALGVDDRQTIDILQECASSNASFYVANSPAALERAFAQIGDRLTRSRLTN